MHLITGAVIAALASKKRQNRTLQGLPRFHTGPIQVAHALSGRIRFIIPAIKENPVAMQAGIKQLAGLRGIKEVAHSPVTGSLTVRFDPQTVPAPLLFAAIARLLNLEDQLNKPVISIAVREMRQLAESLNRMVYDETRGIADLQTLAIAALVITGGKKLLVEKGMAIPGGLTLLWWAATLLNRDQGTRR